MLNLKKWFVRWGIPVVLLAVFVIFTVYINQVDKVALVNREV